MVFYQSNYRTILREQMEARCERNPKYSLRAFARQLGIPASRISEVLSQKQGLSPDWGAKIADRLGFSAAEKTHFCDLIESEHGRSKIKRKMAKIRVAQMMAQNQNSLTLDAFRVISDWYHFAILELVEQRDFRDNPIWIGKRLGIHSEVAKAAVERLLRLEQLERTKDGKLRPTDTVTSTPDGIPSEAIRKFHSQVLEKAQTALRAQKVEERDFSSAVMSLDKRKIPEAKKLIKDFRRRFWAEVGTNGEKDSVYCLSVQFFRLDEELENWNEE